MLVLELVAPVGDPWSAYFPIPHTQAHNLPHNPCTFLPCACAWGGGRPLGPGGLPSFSTISATERLALVLFFIDAVQNYCGHWLAPLRGTLQY